MKRLFESLDFIYVPSTDVAKDLAFYTRRARMARWSSRSSASGRVWPEVGLGGGPGRGSLLAEHLEGEAPVFVYRVADLEQALESLEKRGLEPEARFEIPPGPCAEFRSPGGQRWAIYELTRPERVRQPSGPGRLPALAVACTRHGREARRAR